MRSANGTRLVAMVLAGAVVCTAPRSGAQPATESNVVARSDLDQLGAVLNDPQAPFDRRSEAARRLVSRQSPEAREVLRGALVSLNPNGQLAAARALLDDPEPDRNLIDPLFALLDGASTRSLSEAAARALANYKSNPEVLTRLIAKIDSPLPEIPRREVVRALGSIVEKRAAEKLVTVLRAPGESALIHNAAAEALADLTGITDFGQDTDKWSNWWLQNSTKTDLVFRNDLLPKRSARFDQIKQRFEQLSRELQGILDEQYQATPPEKRPDVLMRYFRSGVPEVRAAGAVILRQEALAAKTIPAAAKEQIRTMIGDSSPEVRIAVARALATFNDAESLDPLLTQLAQESDASVRAALAEALAPIDNIKAVPALLQLLRDPSYSTARAAADALGRLGPRIRTDDPALAERTADELRRTFEALPASPGAAELRGSLVDAMADLKLKHKPLLDLLTGILRENRGESPEMRRRAILAIGEIGDPRYANIVAATLENPDKSIRSAAVRALGMLPNAGEYAELLMKRLDPKEEPEESIRGEIWTVLSSVFPSLPPEPLKRYADAFSNNPERRLQVLQALADVLRRAGRLEELALEQQNIGETLMRFDRVEQYREAANYFKLALDIQKDKGNQVVITNLAESCIKALLRGKQYSDAIVFAGQSIVQNSYLERDLSGAIKIEAERLQGRGEYEEVLKLIAAAREMQPPLRDQYREQLTDIESEVRKKLPTQPSPPGAGPVDRPANASIEK